jgi:EpsI family protein
MQLRRTALVLAALMSIASIASMAARPKARPAGQPPAIVLKEAVPKHFGEWAEVPEQTSQVVNPQVKEELDKIYSQLLTRTYVNKQGYRIMLSMAYGDDQRGGLQAHRPEVCYPGQGFKIAAIQDGALPTPFGNIEVRRMTTTMGARHEPVTYWLTVGDEVVNERWLKRIAEIRLAVTGQIPDGLLFRISSIDTDAARAFAMQEKFAADMMSSVPERARKHLSGLATPASAS